MDFAVKMMDFAPKLTDFKQSLRIAPGNVVGWRSACSHRVVAPQLVHAPRFQPPSTSNRNNNRPFFNKNNHLSRKTPHYIRMFNRKFQNHSKKQLAFILQFGFTSQARRPILALQILGF